MWARISEFYLGLWLAISNLIFGYFGLDTALVVNDILCFILISVFSLCSYVTKLRHLHLFNIAIGFWLIAVNFMGNIHFSASQNYIVIALLILMFSLVPTHADLPPYSWMQFMKMRVRKGANER